ncbi:MAG: hypothetical protein JWN41_561 [Thermoleophilia bacterium]|nr:hypothetical protein [Thermoleophilia bacterium]
MFRCHAPHARRLLMRSPLLAVAMLFCIAPSIANAACSRAVSVRLDRADALAAQLQSASPAAASDARATVARARSRCVGSAYATAVVSAVRYYGAATAGRRVRIGTIALVGGLSDGHAAWQLDVVGLSARATRQPNSHAALRARVALRGAAFGSDTTVWSVDPTKLQFDVGVQSAVARSFATSSLAGDRVVAGHSVRIFAKFSVRKRLSSQPIAVHLAIASRLATAAVASHDARARSAAGATALGAYARVRAATTPTWSRTNGHWSTAKEHRALVTGSSVLLGTFPHPPTAAAVMRLRRSLSTSPVVALRSIPIGSFYPWPRDATLDTQAITAAINKPAALALVIYGSDGATLHRSSQPVDPGVVTIAWDGTRTNGTTVGAGEYRYQLIATDYVGNRRVLPGLKVFRVARDTTPPIVRAAAVRYLNSGALGARVIASWQVEEPLSPRVRTFLVLVSGARHQSMLLADGPPTKAVRHSVRLARGRWNATFVFLDGSGHRVSRAAGALMVR